MPNEYEAKILDVNVPVLRDRLKRLGAEFQGRTLQRRYIYDVAAPRAGAWVRLRENGFRATLAVKDIRDDTRMDGTREDEITVGDFEGAHRLLISIGLRARSYQENIRESHILHGVSLDIDEWPGLKPYLEIEGRSVDEVVATAHALGLSESDLVTANTEALYLRLGMDIKVMPELKFP